MHAIEVTAREGVGPASRNLLGLWGWVLLSASAVLGICLLLWLVHSSWLGEQQSEELVLQQRRDTGRLLVNQVVCIEHWKKLETEDGFKGVVADLASNLSHEEYEWRFIRPNDSDGPGAPRDTFEVQVLDHFVKARPDPKAASDEPMFAERDVPERSEYQYYQPIWAQKSCVFVCHRPPPTGTGIDPAGSGFALGSDSVLLGRAPLSENSLMAVVQVTIPRGPALTALHRNRAIRLSVTIVTVFLLLAFLVVVAALLVLVLVRSRTAIASNPTAPGVRRSEDAEQHTG